MRHIAITFRAPSLTVPINYHHQVQSLLYRLSSHNITNANPLHDRGSRFGNRQYKLFTFSSLRGKKQVQGKQICFTELVYLDVRSVREDFCNALLATLQPGATLTLCGQALQVLTVRATQPQITASRLQIQMLSPLTVHRTDDDVTHYFTPLDADFSAQVNQNFQRKYEAFYGKPPHGAVQIQPLQVGVRDKYVTTYKGTHITAWRGTYALSGAADSLQFLYYAGLGARNASGFGMFQLL